MRTLWIPVKLFNLYLPQITTFKSFKLWSILLVRGCRYVLHVDCLSCSLQREKNQFELGHWDQSRHRVEANLQCPMTGHNEFTSAWCPKNTALGHSEFTSGHCSLGTAEVNSLCLTQLVLGYCADVNSWCPPPPKIHVFLLKYLVYIVYYLFFFLETKKFKVDLHWYFVVVISAKEMLVSWWWCGVNPASPCFQTWLMLACEYKIGIICFLFCPIQ